MADSNVGLFCIKMGRPKNKIQQSKKCEYCGKEYTPFESVNTKYWILSKFCSKSCSAYSRREMYSNLCKITGKLPTSEQEREKLRIIARNKPINPKAIEAMTKANIGRPNPMKGISYGKKHPLWKGNSVSYRSLHKWVERFMGKANHCEFCKDNTEHRYHWANKSHEYHRVLSDWIQLCVKCHKNYDLNK